VHREIELADFARRRHGLFTLVARRDTELRNLFAAGLDARRRRLQRHRLGLREPGMLARTKDAM